MPPLPLALWEGSSNVLNRLKSYYTKDVVETPPLISESTAFLCALLYTACYVAPFYLSSTLRSTPIQSRDAPTVIRARVRAVILTCLVCTVVTVYILAIYGSATPLDVLRLLGIYPIQVIDIVKILSLLTILFIGPLYEAIIVDGDWRDWSPSNLKEGLWDSWTSYRNLIVAPISEELVFRSLTISIYLLAKVDPTRIVYLTPLVFGLAHVHHLVDFLQSHIPPGQRLPPLKIWIVGFVRSLFQFTYTTLFGSFAAFVFLRTGSLWAVIVAHTFCNWQGVPRLYGRVGQGHGFAERVTPDVAQGKRTDDVNDDDNDDEHDDKVQVGNSLMQAETEDAARNQKKEGARQQQQPKRPSDAWTVMYYVLLVAGAYGFYSMLWPLTQSSNALAVF